MLADAYILNRIYINSNWGLEIPNWISNTQLDIKFPIGDQMSNWEYCVLDLYWKKTARVRTANVEYQSYYTNLWCHMLQTSREGCPDLHTFQAGPDKI